MKVLNIIFVTATVFAALATAHNESLRGTTSDSNLVDDSVYLKSDAHDQDEGNNNNSQALQNQFLKNHDGTGATMLPIPSQDNSQVMTMTVEDNARPLQGLRFLERSFTVFDPAHEGNTKRPLVLVYHGVTSDSDTMRQLTQFDREAKDRGWVAVYPQGEWRYSEHMTNWNGAGCCSQGQDDITFTKDMIDYMVQHFNIDENKVFVTGMSNGGFMVYKLLCEMGNRENGQPWIAAAGVHSGLLGAWKADFSSCSALEQTPLVHFHGLADPVVNIMGKPQGEQALGLPFAPVKRAEWKSVDASIDYVAEAMCGSSIITSSSNPAESTTCREMCDGRVETCLVEDLAHKWSGCSDSTLVMFDKNYASNVDATKYFADFFARHSLDQH